MGYNPRTDWTDKPSPIPQVTLRMEQFKEARDEAYRLLHKAQEAWVHNKDMPKYKEGDLVWLEGKNLQTNQPATKLVPKRHGPFRVVQVMSPVNYRLELPTQWSIHPVFHTDLLMPYHETPTHGPNYQCPLPDLVEGEEEYKVEKVLDHQHFGRRRKLQYLIKWKGYPDSDNQWVDKDDVFADDAIADYQHTKSDLEGSIKTLRPSAESPILLSYIPSHMAIDFTADNDGTATLLSISQAQGSGAALPQTPDEEALPVPSCRNCDPSPEVPYGPRVVF